MKVRVRPTSTLHQEVFTETKRGGVTQLNRTTTIRVAGEELSMTPKEFEVYKHLLDVIELEADEMDKYGHLLPQGSTKIAANKNKTNASQG